MKTYKTERLTLKLANIEDAEFFLELYNSPQFIEFIGDKNIRSIKDAEDYVINRFLPQIEKLGFGNYVVILKETNQKIGAVGVFGREGLDVMDIGFSFLERFQKLGYAYESANKVKEIAMNDFGIRKISAITLENNYSSQNLIKKLGLVYVKDIQLPDDPDTLMYFELP